MSCSPTQLAITPRLAAALFAHTQEAIVVTDAEGRVVALNPAFTAMTGYSLGEMLGRTMRKLQSGRHGREFYRNMWEQIRTDGYWQGEIWNRRKNGEIYPALLTISSVRSDTGEIANFVGSSADLSRIKKAEIALDRLAHHDPLTELPNRRLLNQKLEQAIRRAERSGRTGAVLFLDIDGFKNVNDSLGHMAGDELLVQVGKRLSAALDGGDTLARFGGDEFVILMENTTQVAVASRVEELVARLCQPFALSQAQEVFVRASAGISLFPIDGRNADDLLRKADAALYQAKSSGKATYRFFSSELARQASARLAFETDMRRAITKEELLLHYQPVVSLMDRRIIGVEALVRWNHPERGCIAPRDFIRLAEESGLILPMGEWVLRRACSQLKSWHSEGIDLKYVAVNVTPRQLAHSQFVSNIGKLLAEIGLAGEQLELEITESAIVGHDSTSLETLASLKALGVRLAIDDFGTGYSCLAYLKRLPIDKLKIDQSFMTDLPGDRAGMRITAAIISMAKSLGLEVVAEGVETVPQCQFLLKRGCAMGQGFLFSDAVAVEGLPAVSGIRFVSGRAHPKVA
jgi:diguanylate cyclase (GGDEF)-like protein/PAS domain S-box-containing protein